MNADSIKKLKQLLINHEGCKNFPYIDTTNHITIGCGRNLSDRGISVIEALTLLDDDISYFTAKLNHYLPFFSKLNDARQAVLVDMCFNLGVNNFLNFSKMLSAVEKGDFKVAEYEMLNSKWAQQVGERATTLAIMMLTGEF